MHPATESPRTLRPPSRRRLAAGLAALLTVLATAAVAQTPILVPTYAYVQEAEPIAFLRHPEGPSMAGIRGVGILGDERLSIGWFETSEEVLTVSFRLVGDEPASLDGLVLVDGDDIHENVPAGRATIVPAVLSVRDVLRFPYVEMDETGGSAAGIVTNVADRPVTLRRIEMVPHGEAGRLPVLIHEDDEPFDAFVAWERALSSASDALPTRTPPGTPPEPGFPTRLAARMDADGPPLRWVDPAAADLVLPAGASFFWALTPASFRSDVRAATVISDARFVIEREDGSCCDVVQSSGPVSMRAPR